MSSSLLSVFLLVAAAHAQQPRGFDVASIKELPKAASLPRGGMTFQITPASVTATGTLGSFVIHAYSLQSASLKGLPPWASSMFYDLKAKTDTSSSKEEILSMFRTLLADRFGLKTHQETRELNYLAITAGQARAKLKPRDPDAEEPEPVHEVFHLRSPQGVADMLSAWMNVPVVDKTGIFGDFNMTVDVRHANVRDFGDGPLKGPDLVRAMGEMLAHEVEQQLGLKLERRKGPMEVLVVDQALRPSEN
jgi:uncharacterized protein (TIGR03435 family)